MICKVCVAMDAKLRAYWSSPLPGRFQAEYLTSEGTMTWIPRQRQIGAGRNNFKIEVPIAQKYPGEIKQLLCPLGKLLDLFTVCLAAFLCLHSLPSSLHSHNARDMVHSHFPPKTHSDLSCIPDKKSVVHATDGAAMVFKCCGRALWRGMSGSAAGGSPLQNNPSGSSCPSS